MATITRNEGIVGPTEIFDEKAGLRRATQQKPNNRFTNFFYGQKPRGNDPNMPFHPMATLSPQMAPSALSSLSPATLEKLKEEERKLAAGLQPMSVEEKLKAARQFAQFGPLPSRDHLHSSAWEGKEFPTPVEDLPGLFYVLTTYISYLILIMTGHLRDFFGKRFRQEAYKHLMQQDGYAPLNSDFEDFYVRRLKTRINDCFARPTTGVPGRFITLLERKSKDNNETFRLTGRTIETLNLSSYNYLGFAQSDGPCADAVENSIRQKGVSIVSPRADAGTSDLHLEVEDLIAKFVGKPAAMVFSMGFVTNSTSFPALVGKGDLIISDELNHSSIRNGARLSGAMITSFSHNDMDDLERLLREHISQGQPRTHRPWKKILVAVEGLYSMEGTMCNLPGLVTLKKKYKFHLFIDEAHSVGALGPQGGGVCDYFGIDPAEVDILMGTLTKSFGANGGYIAADATIIRKLRCLNAASIFAESPSPPVLVQIAASLKIIAGEIRPGEGQERLQRLAFNSRYLRLGLKRLGFIVSGHDDSPIIPIMLYHPAKMPAFSHEMLKRKISVVVVGYPATPLISSRARFCVSSAHTKDDLDLMLRACDEAGDLLQIKYSSGISGGAYPEAELAEVDPKNAIARTIKPPRWRLEDVLARGVEDAKKPLR